MQGDPTGFQSVWQVKSWSSSSAPTFPCRLQVVDPGVFRVFQWNDGQIIYRVHANMIWLTGFGTKAPDLGGFRDLFGLKGNKLDIA